MKLIETITADQAEALMQAGFPMELLKSKEVERNHSGIIVVQDDNHPTLFIDDTLITVEVDEDGPLFFISKDGTVEKEVR